MNIPEQKTRLRAEMRGRIAAMTDVEKQKKSAIIRDRLLRIVRDERSVCAFMPLPDEPDIRSFLEEALRKKYDLHLPQYEGDAIAFRRVTSLDDLQPGPFGILEPRSDAEPLDRTTADIVLVPGRAFDREGYRLGRGRGGYDRFIADQRKTNPQTRFIGVAFDEQITDRIPTAPHDEAVDQVISSS